jgi:hypothetical protein
MVAALQDRIRRIGWKVKNIVSLKPIYAKWLTGSVGFQKSIVLASYFAAFQ